MNFSLTSDEEDSIFAVKFQSCELHTIPNAIFNNLISVLCVMATSPGFAAITEDSFQGAHSLQFLYLQQNRIEKLDAGTFVHAPNLNEINLAENLIKLVSTDAFVGLEHLESLSLENNDIAFFGLETFYPLKSLMNLDISSNKIEFLDAELFSKNTNLNGINLANNQIISITSKFMNLLPSVKVLNMMNNPCTKNTMLENIPLIKILDSRDLNSEDESSLEKCYKNFIVDFNPESMDPMDVDELISQADEIIDDIEGTIINGLNEELREKDADIKKLQNENNQFASLALLTVGIFILVLFSKCAHSTVNSVYESQVEKLKDVKTDIQATMQPEQEKGCYVIEITSAESKNPQFDIILWSLKSDGWGVEKVQSKLIKDWEQCL